MSATQRTTIRTLAAISFVIGVLLISAGVRANNQRPQGDPTPARITNFDQCAAAGYPIAESYPRQCFADGHGFTEVIE